MATPADLFPQVRRLLHDVEDCLGTVTPAPTVADVLSLARTHMQDRVEPYRNSDAVYIEFVNAGLHRAGCASGRVADKTDVFPMPAHFLHPIAYFVSAQISLQDDEFSASGGRVAYLMQEFDNGLRRSTDAELLAWLNIALNELVHTFPEAYESPDSVESLCAALNVPIALEEGDTIPVSAHWHDTLIHYVAGHAMMKRDAPQDYHKGRYFLARFDRAMNRSGVVETAS